MSSPARIYAGLYSYVLKLAGKALLHRWMYLFLAPAIAIPVSVIQQAIGRIGSVNQTAGFVSGFVSSLILAAACSAVLFIGRAIIEQRRLNFDDVLGGFAAFLNDVLTVLFVVWIASMVLSFVPLLFDLLLLFLLVLPLFETVALSAAGGYAVFEAAWRFVRRDAGPWLVGHLPLLLLVPLYLLAHVAFEVLLDVAPPVLSMWIARFLDTSLDFMFLLILFIYRGILFLTLDNMSPRARAERFGGEPGLR